MRAIAETSSLRVVDLGRIGYADALAIQRETHAALVAAREAGAEGGGTAGGWASEVMSLRLLLAAKGNKPL